MAKLLQIYEDDLADLERILPPLMERIIEQSDQNNDRVAFRRVQMILQNVRWNYGPATEVGSVEA